jgi:hypothetical protein
MSQTVHQNKPSRFRAFLTRWFVTPVRAFLKAWKKATAKTTPRHAPPPVRSGHKRPPIKTGNRSGSPPGKLIPPARHVPPKPPVTPKKQPDRPATMLGTDVRTNMPVSISLEDRRLGQYVIGAIGTGKTTLLLNMILSDICANRGVCLIEPHGDYTRNVLAALPQRRLKDVIYLDLTDSTSSFGLNFFETPPGADDTDLAKAASSVMHLFEAVWAIGPETPRLAQVLRNTTRLMIENPGMTFSEIPLLLWEDGVREKLVRRVTNPQTKLFWSQYNRRSPREREELYSSFSNKCDAYLTEPLISKIVSQSASTIDCRRIMDEGKILLVRLSPQLEEPSRLIGAAILSRLLLASFSRSDTPEQNRRPFMIYADEYQRFATNDFATFQAESRKNWICSTVANQTIEQLSDLNRATALQAGTVTVLRVSGDDSKVLTRSFDSTPTKTIVGEEPVRAIVADPVTHLIRHSHPHPSVAKLVSNYLIRLDELQQYFATLRDSHLWSGPFTISRLNVLEARSLLNETLTTCMRGGKPNLPIPPLILLILGIAEGSGIPYAMESDCRIGLLEYGEFLGLRPSADRYGDPRFLQNQSLLTYLRTRKAEKKVSFNGKKILQTPGPSLIELVTTLRQSLGVLSSAPLLTDTGLFQPKYQLRTYIDQENLIANELSTLPNYTARVKLPTGEHTIRLSPAPAMVSEPELAARIHVIKERMLREGYTVKATTIEEAVAKRHEALRARPASDTPPPKRSSGRRNNTNKKPPPSPDDQ